MQLVRGQKIELADAIQTETFSVGVSFNYGGPGEIDISCFGVDEKGRLSDDRYFIFYNQLSSPEGALRLVGPGQGDVQTFHVTLKNLPRYIHRLIFVATVDGAGAMNQLNYGHIRLIHNGQELTRFFFSGLDFAQEKAVMMTEIYRRDALWRLWAVGQGFSAGLRGVLKHFGGEELLTPPQPRVIVVTEEEARQMEEARRAREEERREREARQRQSQHAAASDPDEPELSDEVPPDRILQ